MFGALDAYVFEERNDVVNGATIDALSGCHNVNLVKFGKDTGAGCVDWTYDSSSTICNPSK